MGLERFSKAQRRKPDDAHCLPCQQEKDDREADYEKEVEEVIIMDETTTSQSDQYETETNPGSPTWAYGNDAVSLAGMETLSIGSANSRGTTGTGWDSFAGDGRPRTTRSVISRSSGNPGFVKQNAVSKDARQKAAEQLAREEARRQQEEEQVERDESDNDSEASDDPY
ncbi:hypothetical protein OHC33_000034 [Knufia fluminis]|uniref:Uncharacterized protein n=1 Tax=Knufia fluminis TaxID=191047 RepID=A0AAN8ESY3_9EURO|nr:hypothetical protein OHC33_000034 [Knufia fluminis]